MTRPNAIDLRVDQLSVHDILTRSATQLVDPERQIAAQRLVHWYLPGWILSVALPAIALFYFWQSGRAARVRDFFRHRTSSEFLARFYFGCTLGAIVQGAALLPEIYDYRVERVFGLSDQLFRSWGAGWLLATIGTMIAIGLVAAIVLALADRTHQWYIYTVVGIFAVSLLCACMAPFVAAPAFDRIGPLPAPAQLVARAAEREAHMHVRIEEQVRRRTHLGEAFVIGLGPTERIVIGNALLEVASTSELRFVIARQLGFAAEASTWKIAVTDAWLLIFGAAIAVAIADRIHFRRDDDPVSRLALVAGMLAVLYVIATPIDNVVMRRLDAKATHYALSLGVDRAAAVRETVDSADQRLQEVCPDILARLFIYKTVDASRAVMAINRVPRTCPP
jgi:STE24 endopeptidase